MSDDVYIIPIIKKSFNWLLKDLTFVLLYLIPVLVTVIQNIHMKIVFGTTMFGGTTSGQNLQFFNFLSPMVGWMIFYMVVSLILGLIVFAIVIQKVKFRIEGKKPNLTKAIRRSLSRLPTLFGSYILLMLLLVGPFIGFLGLIFYGIKIASATIPWVIIGVLGLLIWLLPMIYWGVRLSLFGPACIMEESGPIETLTRSWNLTANNFWLTFSLYVLFGIFYWVVSAPSSFWPFLGGWRVSLIVTVISLIIIAPANMIAVTLYYTSLKKGENFL